MSGPIVRKYGVPNWDEIFGKKNDEERPHEPTADAESRSSERPANSTEQQKDAAARGDASQ